MNLMLVTKKVCQQNRTFSEGPSPKQKTKKKSDKLFKIPLIRHLAFGNYLQLG